ncbi:hypothetical protein Hanom_Chr14g01326721 [Helianthus anomalus]
MILDIGTKFFKPTFRGCLAKLMKLLIDFLEKSGWNDFLEKSLFPSHKSSLPNIFLELMTF